MSDITAINGLLGKNMSAANSWVEVYKVPLTVEYMTVNIYSVNTNDTTDVELTVAITNKTTPETVDTIEFGGIIPSKGALLHTCIICSPGEAIMIRSNSNDVATRVHGLSKPKLVPLV